MEQAQDGIAVLDRMIEPVGREPQVAGDRRQQPVAGLVERLEKLEEDRFEAFRARRPDIGGHVPGEAVIAGKLAADVPEFLQVDMFGVLGDLGLAPNWFDHAVGDGNSVLRLLHYPPIPVDAEGVRAGAHEDINLIPLLLGAEEAGLELLGSDGKWLAIKPPEGAMVVNVGDMLQRLTNHVLPSTTHRVVNPPPERRGVSRYSMPFFLHPAPDFLIETLPGCIDADHPNRYPTPITAHDYLHERLVEIGLVKK